MNPHLTSILSELRNSLATLYGEKLSSLILFGSQARADARPDSDIDVLIVLNSDFNYSQEIERTSELIAHLSLKHNTVISRAFVEREHFHNDDSLFLRNVRREGVSL